MGHRGRLAAKERVAGELAAGNSVRATAEAVGIGESTIYRWRQDGEFRRQVKELRAAMVSDATGVLAAGMTEAAAVLRGLLKSEVETVRLRAATELLRAGHEMAETAELRQQVDELAMRLEKMPT